MAALLLGGCATEAERAKPVRPAEARRAAAEELEALARRGGSLARPVILIGGWMDEPSVMEEVRAWLARCAPGDAARIRVADTRGPGGLSEAADRLVEEFGTCGDVDVVGYSVGGLVAREAAREGRGDRRLRVRRLFAIATPHRGTVWGRLWGIAPQREQLRDVRPGSDFLAALEADPSASSMEITSIWFEGDIVCSRESALAEGASRRVYEAPPGPRVHDGCIRDPRLVRDVVGAILESGGGSPR